MVILNIYVPTSEIYGKDILTQANYYKIDPLLVASVIYKESKFRSNLCFKGAYGLMQIQTRSKKCNLWNHSYLLNARNNIAEGSRLLSYWKRWCKHNKHNHHWLLHYNQGFGKCDYNKCNHIDKRVITSGKIGNYPARVLRIYGALLKIKYSLTHNNIS